MQPRRGGGRGWTRMQGGLGHVGRDLASLPWVRKAARFLGGRGGGGEWRFRGGMGGVNWEDFIAFFSPIAWEGQVSVPDALPSWVWDSRHAPAGHMPAQGCCKVSGNLGRAPSSPLPVAQMQGAFQCPPIAAHFHLPALWERTWCGGWEKKKKTWSEVE